MTRTLALSSLRKSIVYFSEYLGRIWPVQRTEKAVEADAGDIPRGPPFALPHPLALLLGAIAELVVVRVPLVTVKAVGLVVLVQLTGIEKEVELMTVTGKVPRMLGLKVPPVTPAIVTTSPVVSELSRVVVTTQEGLPSAMLPMIVFAVVPKSITGSVRDISHGVPAPLGVSMTPLKMSCWVA